MKIKSMFYAGMIFASSFATGCGEPVVSTAMKAAADKAQANAKPKDKLVISMFDNRLSEGLNIQEKFAAILSNTPDSLGRDVHNSTLINHTSDVVINHLPWDGIEETKDLDAAQCIKAISDSIELHIAKNGHLKVLAIAGHGRTNQMSLGDGLMRSAATPITVVENFDLLEGLSRLQDKLNREGKIKGALADNIVFGGCSVFAELSPADAERYNDYAKKLGPITGSTINNMVNEFLPQRFAGNFVTFTGMGPLVHNEKMSDLKNYVAEAERPGMYGFDTKESIKLKSDWVKGFNTAHPLPGQNGAATASIKKAKPGGITM